MNPIDYWLHEMDDLSVPMGEIVGRIQRDAFKGGFEKGRLAGLDDCLGEFECGSWPWQRIYARKKRMVKIAA